MKKASLLLTVLTIMMFVVCSRSGAGSVKKADHSPESRSDAKILQSWQGDYPVAQLNLLPEKQRERAGGFIDDAKTFDDVWKAFKPTQDVPEIDFKTNLVLFARNTQFYNRISIGKVKVANGVAEVLAMETMSAMPIEDKVAMSMVVVLRRGIKGLKAGDEIILTSASHTVPTAGEEKGSNSSKDEANGQVPTIESIRYLDEVLNVQLVGTRKKGWWEFSIMPSLDDAFTRDYIRIPIRLKRGMTDNFELMAGVTPYINNDKSNENRNGWQDWRIGGKYRFREFLTSYFDSALGLSIVSPIGGEDDTTDGYTHFKPYAVFSKTLKKEPNEWMVFTNVEFDFLSGDVNFTEEDTRDPKDHALRLTPGIIYAPPSIWRASFFVQYESTKISDQKGYNLCIVPGMFLDLPKDYWRWLPGKWAFEFGDKIGAADRAYEWSAVGKVKFDFGSLFKKKNS